MRSKTSKATRLIFRAGCLVSVLGPLIAVVIYPRVIWLFGLLLVGIALLAIIALKSKKATPQEMAELAEGIVNGTSGAWDVDDYEHWNPKDAEARTLWNRTMTLGGLPEEWVRLDEAQRTSCAASSAPYDSLGMNADDCRNQALSHACAFTSPFSMSMSEIDSMTMPTSWPE